MSTTDASALGDAIRSYDDLRTAAPADILPTVRLLDDAYRAFVAAGVVMTARNRVAAQYPPARVDAAYDHLTSYGHTTCPAVFTH